MRLAGTPSLEHAAGAGTATVQPMRTLTLGGTLTLLLALTSCGNDSGEENTAQAATTTTSEAPPAEDPAATPAPECTAAEQADIDAVNASLTGDAVRIGEAFTATDEAGYRYIGANIYDSTDFRMSSADVWVFDRETSYALSGSAREYSALPDGRDLGLSAGDDISAALMDCVVAAL